MFQRLRYHFWLRLSDLVDWLGLSEDTRLECVIRAARLVDYGLEPKTCDGCDAIAPPDWSKARERGWSLGTWQDGEVCVLCPECQEPTERIQPWT